MGMCAVLLLLAVGLLATSAQASGLSSSNAVATLTAAKAGLYKDLVTAAGVEKLFSHAQAPITLLVPTDEAVRAFLQDMGLTMDDVKNQQHLQKLARKIVAYHTVLGTAGTKKLFSNATVQVPTVDSYSSITAKRGSPSRLIDAQNNEAQVVQADLGGTNHTVHTINRVLYSESYFKHLPSVFKLHPKSLSTLAAAVAKSATSNTLTTKGSQTFSGTLFLPTDQTLKKLKKDPSTASQATLDAFLKRYMLPDALLIPGGFKSGVATATLAPPHTVTVTYHDEGKRGSMKTRRAFVTADGSVRLTVVRPNLSIGKAVGHVMDSLASGAASPAAAAAAAPGAGSLAHNAGQPQPKLTTEASGRKLLQRWREFYMPTNGGFFRPPNTIGSAYQPYYESMDNSLNSDVNPSPAGQFDGDNNQGALMYPDWPTYYYGSQ